MPIARNIKRLTAKPKGSPNNFFMFREIVKICLPYYYKFFCNTNTMTVEGRESWNSVGRRVLLVINTCKYSTPLLLKSTLPW